MSEQSTKLGELAPEGAGRDAIHIACAPVRVTCAMLPGDRCALIPGTVDEVTRVDSTNPDYIGIVDPFLTHPVVEGERVWLLLRPNTITGLTHVWTHPVFARHEGQMVVKEMLMPSAVERAKTRLMEYAVAHNESYETLMDALSGWGTVDQDSGLCYTSVPAQVAEDYFLVTGDRPHTDGFHCAC